jgi:hypothetical protein
MDGTLIGSSAVFAGRIHATVKAVAGQPPVSFEDVIAAYLIVRACRILLVARASCPSSPSA